MTIRLTAILFLALGLHGQVLTGVFSGTYGTTPTVADPATHNSGGSCTGSDGAGWTCSSATTVTMDVPSGGITCYTNDGTTNPATNGSTCTTGTQYSTGISTASTTTYKMISGKVGSTNSNIVTVTYTISGSTSISRDNAADLHYVTSASSFTTGNFTVGSGSNRILFAMVIGDATSDLVTSVTFNGSSMTQVAKVHAGNWLYAYCIVAPSSGAHTFTVSASGTASALEVEAISYAGALQSCTPDNSNTGTAASGNTTINLTANATVSGDWGVAFFNGYNGNNAPTAGGLGVTTDGSATVTWVRGSSPTVDWEGEGFEIPTTACTSGSPCIVSSSTPPNLTTLTSTTSVTSATQLLTLHNQSTHTYNTRQSYEPDFGEGAIFDSNGVINPTGAYNFQCEWPGASSVTIGGIVITFKHA